ncbi:4'-phosphopantetheinyl transferase superfamily [Catenaria anguillulae PL171]|uniref:4'-phosphopantetheinyl transferase superfamily n=1 Tax=Catenaria anguillulae PL171 TaxID=765915 RepID=A0A1Y2HGM2_9FUNG|nr:4'-phosphopantetheinyl transferase superfamily [Catenaria anguillulae PL171]
MATRILGIGVDILDTSRIARLLAQPVKAQLFARRILSTHERAQFAAKEAVFKACYPHTRLLWDQVSVVKPDDGPKPVMLIHGPPVLADRVAGVHLSVSHDGEYLVAMVVVEEKVGAGR